MKRLVKEFTLGIIKPNYHDLFKIEKDVNKVLAKKNLKIIKSQRLQRWPRNNVEEFYSEHKGKFFYQRLIHFMSSGPITAIVIYGPNAISEWRNIIGPTHIAKARENPDCLRSKYGFSDTKNAFHGSDSRENAVKEIKHFFPNFDFEKDYDILDNVNNTILH